MSQPPRTPAEILAESVRRAKQTAQGVADAVAKATEEAAARRQQEGTGGQPSESGQVG